MKKSSKLTRAERKEYIKERIREFEEWKARETERFSTYTKAEMRKFDRECIADIKYASKQTREEIAEIDEIDRLTMDPNFDERTYEEELFGPLDDDDCYTSDGYYVYADRYDEAAKQRPPIRKNRPQTAAAAPTPAEPRVAREETVACAV
jgi:hypothetical protein